MRIAVTTDNHWGFSKAGNKANEKMFSNLAQENPDVLVQCGDFSSHLFPQKKEFWTMVRSHFPRIPILTVMGNHDWWGGDETIPDMPTMLAKTDEVLAELNIVHLGPVPFQLPDHKTAEIITFHGVDGWYFNQVPGTNDVRMIPGYDFDWLTSRAQRDMARAVQEVAHTISDFRILVTHFGFLEVEAKSDWKARGSGHYFGGDPAFEELIAPFNAMLYGHSHRYFQGRSRTGVFCLNTGSDYENPATNILDIQEVCHAE